MTARGGAGTYNPEGTQGGSGSGGGGVVRPVAPEINGNGALDARAGGTCGSDYQGSCGGDGLIRIEAFDIDLSLQTNANPGILFAVPQPAVPFSFVKRPRLEVVDISGKTPIVGANVGYIHQRPNLSLTASSTVTVTVQAQYVPIGTPITCVVGTVDQGRVSYTTPGLVGTLEQSTAEVDVDIPVGAKLGTIECFIPHLPLPKD